MDERVRANTGKLPMRSDIAGCQQLLIACQRGPVRLIRMMLVLVAFKQRTNIF